MELPPILYHWFVRPKWFFDIYIGNIITTNFSFDNKTVLDFGCGVGSSCFMLNPSNYIGIDCDSRRIDYAKRLYPDYNFDVLCGNQLPIDDNSIDYILIISVLHHIPPGLLKDYMKEFYRVIKKDGKIIINEPCFFEKSYFNNLFMSFFDKGNN